MQNTSDAPQVERAVIVAAKAAVARSAAHELVVFDAAVSLWRTSRTRHGRRRRWRALGGSAGFGADTALVTDLVLQAATAATGEVLVLAAATGGSWLRRWRRARRRPNAVSAEVSITADQAACLRAACQRHGTALGLTSEIADVLADALVGAVQTPRPTR